MPLSRRVGGFRRWFSVVGLAFLIGSSASSFASAQEKAKVKDKDQEETTSTAKTTGAKQPYIDRMLKDSWQSASLRPSKQADDAEFMRRAYLDAVGRIPNLAEARAFLTTKEPGKRAKLVEYLLAHPDYAKNQAVIWQVVLVGRQRQERNVDKKALTDWLRKQFLANRPWNELSFDLITATGSNKENGAANYTMSHMENGAVNLTSITTRVFLGQQIQCTQCHDHPSNDWKQADFWGINAFFKGVRTRDVQADKDGTLVYDHTEVTDEPSDAFAQFERRDARMGIAFPTFLDGRKISQGRDVNRRQALGKFITEQANNDFAKAFVNRTWGHFFGKGFVNPVDDFGPHSEPTHPELLDQLAKDFKASGYDVKQLIRWIMNSDAYQLTSKAEKFNEKDESLFTHMNLKPMTPEQLFESLLVATSAHKTGGDNRDNIERRRDDWFRQFQVAFANDEGEENNAFQGTIPQALMMMNGPLMAEAVGGKPGSFLADVLEKAKLQRSGAMDYVVANIYLAALSRVPSNGERTNAKVFLSSSPDTINVMEDLFWALLNSNEFILNH